MVSFIVFDSAQVALPHGEEVVIARMPYITLVFLWCSKMSRFKSDSTYEIKRRRHKKIGHLARGTSG